MNICQLTIFCMLINGMFTKVEAVNKKLQKSFVEIFGEGWDEEERREEIGKVTGDWQNDDKQIEKETATIGDQMKHQQRQQQETSSGARNNDQDNQKNERNDGEDEKREIIRKWYAIKAKIKQRKGKQSRKEWEKTEKLLAKKLGRSKTTIYKWIREMRMRQRRSNEKKLELMRQYWEMKRSEPKMSDKKIAKALQIGKDSIRKWKSQFREELGIEMKIQLIISDEQKRKIVGEFRAIKEKIKQKRRKYSREQWKKVETLLAKKLGTYRTQIYEWIKELGVRQRKRLTNEAKLALMRQYWEMKRNNPKISDTKIAKTLNVCRQSIRKWKCKFRELGMEMKCQLNVIKDERKREIVGAFKAMKEEMKQQNGKQSREEWQKIENLFAKKLDTSRTTIYKWSRELGMGQMRRTNEKEEDEKRP